MESIAMHFMSLLAFLLIIRIICIDVLKNCISLFVFMSDYFPAGIVSETSRFVNKTCCVTKWLARKLRRTFLRFFCAPLRIFS